MPKAHNWYPIEIYDILYKLGRENNLSYHEVAFMVMREALLPFGFDCDHPSDKIEKSPTDNQPYCKNCMSRLETFEYQTLNERRFDVTKTGYRAKQTFLDKIRIENKQKLEADFEARIKAEVDTRIKALIEDAIRKEREKVQ
jgi:hypothetical protein